MGLEWRMDHLPHPYFLRGQNESFGNCQLFIKRLQQIVNYKAQFCFAAE
jgi:hypothetical protein